MKTRVRTLFSVPVFALALCPAPVPWQEAAPAPAVKPAAATAEPEFASLKLVLVKPSMRFEDIRSQAMLPAQASKEAEYEHDLLHAARTAAGSKATVLEMDKLDLPAAEACNRLQVLASRLARGIVNEEATEILGQLSALDERFAVLVQFFRLKTGPGRSWNPNTGAITSSTDSTLIQVALVSCKTGKVIWKGEQLVRNKALKTTDAHFHKTLSLLYQDFDVK